MRCKHCSSSRQKSAMLARQSCFWHAFSHLCIGSILQPILPSIIFLLYLPPCRRQSFVRVLTQGAELRSHASTSSVTENSTEHVFVLSLTDYGHWSSCWKHHIYIHCVQLQSQLFTIHHLMLGTYDYYYRNLLPGTQYLHTCTSSVCQC